MGSVQLRVVWRWRRPARCCGFRAHFRLLELTNTKTAGQDFRAELPSLGFRVLEFEVTDTSRQVRTDLTPQRWSRVRHAALARCWRRCVVLRWRRFVSPLMYVYVCIFHTYMRLIPPYGMQKSTVVARAYRDRILRACQAKYARLAPKIRQRAAGCWASRAWSRHHRAWLGAAPPR
ncbi:hypothetical protein FRC0484_00055 [Corynebacterium diphtheriae]|nr:hypothetical protein FRC0484_00055 [Corynebacterium diphtheriae]